MSKFTARDDTDYEVNLFEGMVQIEACVGGLLVMLTMTKGEAALLIAALKEAIDLDT